MACLTEKTKTINIHNTNNIPTDMTTCILCWEDKRVVPTKREEGMVTLPCRHAACQACLEKWIQQCERKGYDQASCPTCRQTMDHDAIQSILGRGFQRQSKLDDNQQLLPQLENEDDEFDFTQTWLQDNNAQACMNCGMYMVREDYSEEEEEQDNEDIVRASACLCGWIYCWTCNESAFQCACDHKRFFDHCTEQDLPVKQAREQKFPVAGPQDMGDFQEFLETRRTAIWGRDPYDSDDEDDEDEESPREEPADPYVVPLFEEYTEPAEFDFVPIVEWTMTEVEVLAC